ncbi:polysaccharide export outer membrane protein [Chitinivorax tropicus]|uniref:Polysaccharide export outer membrane protein n=1 Tax=Chitinivorax tropicus TaxID=714531 RepID=A0A840MK69_9PROT|nr:polysaccharide export protein EpsE [Chitinivorax tropicus]MBB5019584.1 polysaccharide export outer membrane protein [Chitinivorax tropicus]
MMQWVVRFFAACLFLQAAICSAAAGDYQLGAGDVVRIAVYGQNDLTTEARVSEAGGVIFPLVGDVAVMGLSAKEAGQRIADALRRGGFVKQPEVSVLVTQYRSKQVSILGNVNKPGRYPLETASTLTDLLAMAGGAAPQAADDIVLIQRRDGKLYRREIDTLALLQQGDRALDVAMGNGDVIYVPRAAVFYIYGEVQRPGSYRLERKMSVAQALSLGGGITPRGTEGRIVVKRRDGKGVLQTTSISVDDAIQADDVLQIKERVF